MRIGINLLLWTGHVTEAQRPVFELLKGIGYDLVEIPVHLIAVEKQEPFRCGVWVISTEVLRQAQLENEEAIKRLKACEENCLWPTGYEDMRVFDAL